MPAKIVVDDVRKRYVTDKGALDVVGGVSFSKCCASAV